MVHRAADSRLLGNLLSQEKDYHKHLIACLDASHSELASLSAYAAASHPPTSNVILTVVGTIAAANEALLTYAHTVEDWRAQLKKLKVLEDEIATVLRDRDILVTRLIKASKNEKPNRDSSSPSALHHHRHQQRPLSLNISLPQPQPQPQPPPHPASSSSVSLRSDFSGTASINTSAKLGAAQAELRACEAHLAQKERALDLFRTSVVRDGLGARCRAMTNCGWVWSEMGKEGVKEVEGMPVQENGVEERLAPALNVEYQLQQQNQQQRQHQQQHQHQRQARRTSNIHPSEMSGRPASDLSSLSPSQSASQINTTAPPPPQSEVQLNIPPAHAISERDMLLVAAPASISFPVGGNDVAPNASKDEQPEQQQQQQDSVAVEASDELKKSTRYLLPEDEQQQQQQQEALLNGGDHIVTTTNTTTTGAGQKHVLIRRITEEDVEQTQAKAPVGDAEMNAEDGSSLGEDEVEVGTRVYKIVENERYARPLSGAAEEPQPQPIEQQQHQQEPAPLLSQPQMQQKPHQPLLATVNRRFSLRTRRASAPHPAPAPTTTAAAVSAVAPSMAPAITSHVPSSSSSSHPQPGARDVQQPQQPHQPHTNNKVYVIENNPRYFAAPASPSTRTKRGRRLSGSDAGGGFFSALKGLFRGHPKEVDIGQGVDDDFERLVPRSRSASPVLRSAAPFSSSSSSSPSPSSPGFWSLKSKKKLSSSSSSGVWETRTDQNLRNIAKEEREGEEEALFGSRGRGRGRALKAYSVDSAVQPEYLRPGQRYSAYENNEVSAEGGVGMGARGGGRKLKKNGPLPQRNVGVPAPAPAVGSIVQPYPEQEVQEATPRVAQKVLSPVEEIVSLAPEAPGTSTEGQVRTPDHSVGRKRAASLDHVRIQALGTDGAMASAPPPASTLQLDAIPPPMDTGVPGVAFAGSSLKRTASVRKVGHHKRSASLDAHDPSHVQTQRVQHLPHHQHQHQHQHQYQDITAATIAAAKAPAAAATPSRPASEYLARPPATYTSVSALAPPAAKQTGGVASLMAVVENVTRENQMGWEKAERVKQSLEATAGIGSTLDATTATAAGGSGTLGRSRSLPSAQRRGHQQTGGLRARKSTERQREKEKERERESGMPTAAGTPNLVVDWTTASAEANAALPFVKAPPVVTRNDLEVAIWGAEGGPLTTSGSSRRAQPTRGHGQGQQVQNHHRQQRRQQQHEGHQQQQQHKQLQRSQMEIPKAPASMFPQPIVIPRAPGSSITTPFVVPSTPPRVSGVPSNSALPTAKTPPARVNGTTQSKTPLKSAMRGSTTSTGSAAGMGTSGGSSWVSAPAPAPASASAFALALPVSGVAGRPSSPFAAGKRNSIDLTNAPPVPPLPAAYSGTSGVVGKRASGRQPNLPAAGEGDSGRDGHQEVVHTSLSDSASESSYETGREVLDDSAGEAQAQAQAQAGQQQLLLPGSQKAHAHAHAQPPVTASGTQQVGQQQKQQPTKRKSVRVSLKPTFSPTPPAPPEVYPGGGGGGTVYIRPHGHSGATNGVQDEDEDDYGRVIWGYSGSSSTATAPGSGARYEDRSSNASTASGVGTITPANAQVSGAHSQYAAAPVSTPEKTKVMVNGRVPPSSSSLSSSYPTYPSHPASHPPPARSTAATRTAGNGNSIWDDDDSDKDEEYERAKRMLQRSAVEKEKVGWK